MLSPSNLAYVLDAARDVGEPMPEDKAVVRKAGYLLFNLVNLHPFLDGNKRTVFEVAKNFLKLNGWAFEPEECEAFNTLVSIARGSLDAESTEKWMAKDIGGGVLAVVLLCHGG